MEYPKQSFTPESPTTQGDAPALYLKVAYFDTEDHCDKVLTVPFEKYLNETAELFNK